MEKGFLGIEIGDKILRYVYVAKQKGVNTLLRAGQMEAIFNFKTAGTLTETIQTIIDNEELRPERIFVTISRRDTLIHQQLMPRMPASELDEVVPGEIEKIPFFYNQSFEYCFKVFPHSRDKERVVMVAVGEDFLRSVIEEVDATKIYFRDIEIAPLNLKEILPLPRPAERCEAVLVVQELCSYFCIYKGPHYVGFYRSPIGAEQILSPMTVDNRDQVIFNWVGELDRVTKSHLVEEPNHPIEQLWVVADKSISEDIAIKLNKRLDINTEILSAGKIDQLSGGSSAEWNSTYATALTPIVLHLGSRKPLFPLDHFFANFRVQKYAALTALKTLIFLITLVFGIGGMNYFIRDNLATMRVETKKLAFSINNLNQQNKDLFAEKNDYLDVRKKLLSQAQYVQEINRTSWTRVLAAMANELPSDLSLTGFKFSESGNVQIKGDTFDITTIANLIRKVDQSSILEGGKFDFLKEKKEKEAKLFNFGIQANLKVTKEASHGKEKN